MSKENARQEKRQQAADSYDIEKKIRLLDIKESLLDFMLTGNELYGEKCLAATSANGI